MTDLSELKTQHIRKNEFEYAEKISEINFLSFEDSKGKQSERDELVTELKQRVESGYNDSKLDVDRISPGCRSCAEGNWSCLFINGKCNSRCFYCPTNLDKEDIPTTQTIQFPKVEDYLDYIEKFGYKGISISGGEPLLTPGKTLKYIQEVRRKFSDSVYIWMYTNGTLLTRETAVSLADAGVNEIRFDIGATDYSLEFLKIALDKIETVTVEIPAVPEDFEIMKKTIKDLEKLGIRHLNLHQMRLTPYNFANLVKRDYTFLHGEKVTVMDSELAALKLMKHVFDHDISLPINYCSFIYKNRFQRSSARKRNADFMIKPYEEVTGNGYIRTIYITGSELLFSTNWNAVENDFPESSWFDEKTKRLYVKKNILKHLDWSGENIFLKYGEAVLLPGITYSNPFKIVDINLSKKVVVEYVKRFEKEFLSTKKLANVLESVLDEEDNADYSLIENFEKIGWGFQEYY